MRDRRTNSGSYEVVRQDRLTTKIVDQDTLSPPLGVHLLTVGQRGEGMGHTDHGGRSDRRETPRIREGLFPQIHSLLAG